jgi:hypothetical protein
MKVLLIAWTLVLPLVAARADAADPLEEGYFTARNAYIKHFAHSPQNGTIFKAHEAALADLQAKLRRIIGVLSLKAFSIEGKINLDALDSGDEGFGKLDGLVYISADRQTQVLVTTASLFDNWLKAHARFWPQAPLPSDMSAALKRDDFYTQAINNGAAVVTYAEIPVTQPAWATLAFAVLDGRTQDAPPHVPNEMIITVRRADRVFIVTAQTGIAAGPIAACDERQARRAIEALVASEADRRADNKNAALHAKAEELAREADRAYPECFAREARKADFFPALVKQAQGLVDMLLAK